MESADPRVLFRRTLADFECIQDLVLLGVNSRVDIAFLGRLELAPRDMVTCLSTRGAPVEACPAYRVSAAYMERHPHATDIAAGARAAHAYFGEQPVLA